MSLKFLNSKNKNIIKSIDYKQILKRLCVTSGIMQESCGNILGIEDFILSFGRNMNKLSVLVFSLAVVILSATSTAHATDLKSAWLEYQNARNLLNDSFAQIDAAWALADSGWDNGPKASRLQVIDSWNIISNSWAEIDAARAIVASTLKIYLSDSSERGRMPITPRGWVSANSAWTELDSAWAGIRLGNEVIAGQWARTDEEWAKINTAWAEIDAAWAGKK